MKALRKLISILTVTTFIACSGGEGSEDVDVRKDPYQKWDANTTSVFEGTVPSNQEAVVKVEKTPGTETVIGGRTYSSYKAGFVASKDDDLASQSANVGVATASVDEDGTIYISTLESNGILGTITGLPGLDIFAGQPATFDPPIVINMEEMAIGETRDAAISLQLAAAVIPVTVSYGPVEDNVTLMTGMGPILGCRKYHVEGSFTYEGLPLTGTLIKGDGYYHSSLGLVGWDAPELGIGLSMSGTTNFGDVTEGFNIIEKADVLSGNHTNFSLDTYDRIGQYDANKNIHAKMILELRWADPNVAVTHDAPHSLMAPVTFGTLGGLYYFPHELVESPASIFFPAENGNGFRYWYAFVDQAAKNQEEKGISYSIEVGKDPSLPDLRVTARIGYTILPAGTY